MYAKKIVIMLMMPIHFTSVYLKGTSQFSNLISLTPMFKVDKHSSYVDKNELRQISDSLKFEINRLISWSFSNDNIIYTRALFWCIS